ncbi:uncharacterized protein LOC128553924 [Mercenaria mercenaria]|uniref:uncharacterized protein LOC128553924 n=1 Tax=Mercenaria mercenaria TaxID=6596 RepID=UPI00234EA2B4|nr:uncharacterized protein LOC128553924 [Mercenaria mercenaria]
MWTHFILIFLFRQSFTADSAKSFKLISDNEVKSIDFLANAVRDDTLIQYLVERIENIERFAKTEHENNLVLKERVVQLEARDRQRDHQFAEIQERCEHLESKLGQEMISRRSNEIDTPVNQNASSRHGSHSGDDIFHVKQLMASHERNYGKNHSMMKKAKHTRGSDDYRILTPVNEEPVAFFATLGKHMVNTGVNQVIPSSSPMSAIAITLTRETSERLSLEFTYFQ